MQFWQDCSPNTLVLIFSFISKSSADVPTCARGDQGICKILYQAHLQVLPSDWLCEAMFEDALPCAVLAHSSTHYAPYAGAAPRIAGPLYQQRVFMRLFLYETIGKDFDEWSVFQSIHYPTLLDFFLLV